MKNEEVIKKELKYNKGIKSTVIMLVILVVLRLYILDLFSVVSESLNAIILFIFLNVKGKCMAILILICSVAATSVGIIRLNHILVISKSNYGNYLSSIDFWATVYSFVVYTYEFLIGFVGANKYSWENAKRNKRK